MEETADAEGKGFRVDGSESGGRVGGLWRAKRTLMR